MRTKLLFIGLIILISWITVDAVGAKSKSNISSTSGASTMSDIYQFKVMAIDGKQIDLDSYKGKVMLIVNTASHCGFTPQYAGLEKLHEEFAPKGLVVLGFPCNQFGNQEPGNENEISAFCQKNFGVKFQMFQKIDVNGANEDPLYKYLKHAMPGALGTEAIKWNFTKFLIDRNGHVVKRYAPNVAPSEISGDIEKLVGGLQ
jgi:glutathione peroxidase